MAVRQHDGTGRISSQAFMSKEQDKKDHLRDDKLTKENLDFMSRSDFKRNPMARHIIACIGIPYEILNTHGFYEETLLFKNSSST